jgi:hypothetical protein
MQIDKPDDDYFLYETQSSEVFVAPGVRLEVRGASTSSTVERAPLRRSSFLSRRPRIHPRSLVGMALIGAAAIASVLLARAAMKRRAKPWYRM